jgi:Phosphodiester glycosidase
MAKHRARRAFGRAVALWSVVLLVVVATATTVYVRTVTTTTTTTTTIPPEQPEAGWRVASASDRGVMVDFRNVTADGATFRVVRLRARTTLLRWHVGNSDPNAWRSAPADAGAKIAPSEYQAGVIAVFNGAFKQAAKAGGAVVDGVTLEPLVRGDMTVALDNAGHWEMGVWGAAGFPTKHFDVVSYRQNLTPLVSNGVLAHSAAVDAWGQWGDPLHAKPLTPRTGLGIDAQGNLLYVATMTGVLPKQVGEALISAGAVTGMELDMNPYWPILGAGGVAHNASQISAMNVQVPGGEHLPTVYATGWERDFFVALAEPNAWTCQWQSAGLGAATSGAQPQPLTLAGRHCGPAVTSPTTTLATTTTLP